MLSGLRGLTHVCHRHATLAKSVSLPCRGIVTGEQALRGSMHFLNGKRTDGTNADKQDDYNIHAPATGGVLCSVRGSSESDVNEAVTSAQSTLSQWSGLPPSQRATVLYNTAQIIRANLEELAVAEVYDTGKPIWEARFDVEGCADTVEYCAGLARMITGQHVDLGNGNFGYTRREPLGVVGAIGAWNYPFQMATWKSAGALSCGNTVVYKPSPLTPITTTMLGEIYAEAGLPDGAYNVIQGDGRVGAALCSHPLVAKMTFTGSVPTGTKVMEACAKGIKYVLLELGGKSPLVIFADADLDNAVKGTMLANFLTQGQVCSNGTRVFVERPIYEAFLDKLIPRVQAIKLGDPLREDTTMGAVISPEQADIILQYIESAKSEGARVMTGGERVRPDPTLEGGQYISPCVLTELHDNMKVVREEVFGPVACVLPFDTEDEVIGRANDTEFGLAGGIFTRDLTRAHRVASKIQAGNIYINNYNVYPSELPFGGYKKSGLGRENSALNIDAFTQVKTVIVEMGDVESPI